MLLLLDWLFDSICVCLLLAMTSKVSLIVLLIRFWLELILPSTSAIAVLTAFSICFLSASVIVTWIGKISKGIKVIPDKSVSPINFLLFKNNALSFHLSRYSLVYTLLSNAVKSPVLELPLASGIL